MILKQLLKLKELIKVGAGGAGGNKTREKETEGLKDKIYTGEGEKPERTDFNRSNENGPKPCVSCSVLIHNVKGDMD